MNITLPILHHNHRTASVKDLEVTYELKDCKAKSVTFYRIDAISPFTNSCSTIYVGSREFICDISYGELWEKLK
jgi:wobble nucleotide-excising tRNase